MQPRSILSSLLLSVVAAITFCGATTTLKAQGLPGMQPCPCKFLYPGNYYVGKYYDYKPVLFTNMPLDVFVGYVILDSIFTHIKPSHQVVLDSMKGLTCENDILKYALKYLYRLADYDPYLYYNFLTSKIARKQSPMSILPYFFDEVKKICGLPTQEIIKAEYILHIQSNAVEPLTYESSPGDSTYLDYVYCQVIDTIKGKVLPDINGNGAITVFLQDSAGIQIRSATTLSVPENSNFVFYYNRRWVVENTTSKSQIKVEADKEYIVFAWTTNACNENIGEPYFDTGLLYYDIRPTTLDLSGGIFPIVDGNVIDKGNDFGWGTSVPVNVFKTNLQILINSIKNYGE